MDITERQLVKISLVGTIIGLVALYFVVQGLVPEKRSIGNVTIGLIGNHVEVTGSITDLKKSGDNVFFTLDDETGKIKVVLWKNVLDRLKLAGVELEKIKNGNKIQVVGTVEGYKGGLEIIGKEVKIG